MPSGRTSMLELPANVLLATHPACSERRHRQPSRRSHERKLGDQTKDDADKEPREERSCGRSQTLLYNEARTHLSVNKDAPSPRTVHAVGRILPTPFLGGLHHLYVRVAGLPVVCSCCTSGRCPIIRTTSPCGTSLTAPRHSPAVR